MAGPSPNMAHGQPRASGLQSSLPKSQQGVPDLIFQGQQHNFLDFSPAKIVAFATMFRIVNSSGF